MEIINDYDLAAKYLNEGKIGIVPTDTIYGFSCLASSKASVIRIYDIKKRDSNKPFILLISSVDDLQRFNVVLSNTEKAILDKYWPGPVSIQLEVENPELEYLHRGTGHLAFRLPAKATLIELLEKTGPIISTSANLSSQNPITSIQEAKELFGDKVDFFLDEGELNNPPSRVIKIENGNELVIRA